MIKIIFRFSQKSIEAYKQIINQPTYQTFRKFNITFQQGVNIIDQIQNKQIKGNAKLIINLFTYIRKQFSNDIIRSRQELLQLAIDDIKLSGEYLLIPSLLSNINYCYQPELYLSQACDLLLKNSSQMDIKCISNCVYTIGKIARKNVQIDHQNEKMINYNAALITLQELITIIKLKTINCRDIQILTEILIGYQKMEIDIQEHIYQQLNQIEFNKFKINESQLLHTISRNENLSVTGLEIKRKLYDCMVKSIYDNSITITSMALGLKGAKELVSEDLLKYCQEQFHRQSDKVNITDLSMMAYVSFTKGIITKEFSNLLTNAYELLKENADINVINFLIPNMAQMINLRLLDKKFINLFLITVKVLFLNNKNKKILSEKNKINRQFYKQFAYETKKIENEEIRNKFEKIKFTLDQI